IRTADIEFQRSSCGIGRDGDQKSGAGPADGDAGGRGGTPRRRSVVPTQNTWIAAVEAGHGAEEGEIAYLCLARVLVFVVGPARPIRGSGGRQIDWSSGNSSTASDGAAVHGRNGPEQAVNVEPIRKAGQIDPTVGDRRGHE